MSMQINRESYEKLIVEDLEWLKNNAPESLERTHIVKVLVASINLIYGEDKKD